MQVVMSRSQLIEVPSCSKDSQAIGLCLQMHQLRPSTIRLDQHTWHANHTLMIQPHLAGLWGLCKFRFFLLQYCLKFKIIEQAASHSVVSPLRREEYNYSDWSSSVWIWGSSLAFSAVSWPRRQLSLSSCAQLHFLHRKSVSRMFLRPVPSMRISMAPSKFISVWTHPKIRTMPLMRLLCGASMMISAAFQYKGWSKVIMVGRLCFMARLQTKSNVDRMHDLSPEYILIIGNHLIDDCPGYWLPDARYASSPANSVLPLWHQRRLPTEHRSSSNSQVISAGPRRLPHDKQNCTRKKAMYVRVPMKP